MTPERRDEAKKDPVIRRYFTEEQIDRIYEMELNAEIGSLWIGLPACPACGGPTVERGCKVRCVSPACRRLAEDCEDGGKF